MSAAGRASRYPPDLPVWATTRSARTRSAITCGRNRGGICISAAMRRVLRSPSPLVAASATAARTA